MFWQPVRLAISLAGVIEVTGGLLRRSRESPHHDCLASRDRSGSASAGARPHQSTGSAR